MAAGSARVHTEIPLAALNEAPHRYADAPSSQVTSSVVDLEQDLNRNAEKVQSHSLKIIFGKDGVSLIAKWRVRKKLVAKRVGIGAGFGAGGGIIVGLVAIGAGLKVGGKLVSKSCKTLVELFATTVGVGTGTGAAGMALVEIVRFRQEIPLLRLKARQFSQNFPREHVRNISEAFFTYHFRGYPEETLCPLTREFIWRPVALKTCVCKNKRNYEHGALLEYYQREQRRGLAEIPGCPCKEKFHPGHFQMRDIALQQIAEVVRIAWDAVDKSIIRGDMDVQEVLYSQDSPGIIPLGQQQQRIREITENGKLCQIEAAALKLYLRSGLDNFNQLMRDLHARLRVELTKQKSRGFLDSEELQTALDEVDGSESNCSYGRFG